MKWEYMCLKREGDSVEFRTVRGHYAEENELLTAVPAQQLKDAVEYVKTHSDEKTPYVEVIIMDSPTKKVKVGKFVEDAVHIYVRCDETDRMFDVNGLARNRVDITIRQMGLAE